MTLENLLNNLIQRWRIPFGDEKIHSFKIIYVTWKILNIVAKRWRWQVNMHYSIREICSKSSWLWQFVCENGMVDEESCQYIEDKEICTSDEWVCYYNDDWYPMDNYYKLDRTEAEFWVIESALIDESKLDQFLLDNIEVWNE